MKAPHPLVSAAGIALHGGGLFVLPLAVGGAVGMVVDAAEVTETLSGLLTLTAVFVLPPLGLQLTGVYVKVDKEVRFLRQQGRLDLVTALGAVYRHVQIVTPRGWAALFTGLWFIALSLIFKWASLGLLAVLSLLLFYAVLGGTSFVSTFLVRTFAVGMGRGEGGIRRELSPAVVTAGDAAEERFHLTRVPVPPGFVLLVEDDNPPLLATQSRYAIGPGARRTTVTVAGRFRRTPRGLYRLGPARIWYQDALGFTRVSVASLATAELKVLPRFRPLQIVAPPKSALEAPDVLTKPHRFATEDHFRFKEYATGDDTRRVHWRLSMRTGRMQVRLPETREVSSRQVVLVLDSYLPPGRMLADADGMGAVLDRLVETWISLAQELVERGDRVLLAAAVDDGRGNIAVEQTAGDRTARRRWQDLGARARWQGDFDVSAVLSAVGPATHGLAVSSRFFAPPPSPVPDQGFTWVYLPPIDALGPPERALWEVIVGPGPGAGRRLLGRLARLPGPAGSDENALGKQVRDILHERRLYHARARMRAVARREGARTLGALVARGDAVYRLEPGPVGHRLVGLTAGRSSKAAG